MYSDSIPALLSPSPSATGVPGVVAAEDKNKPMHNGPFDESLPQHAIARERGGERERGRGSQAGAWGWIGV